MVSGFIDEVKQATVNHKEGVRWCKTYEPCISMHAQQILEMKEGCTSDNFMVELEKAVKIAKIKYPFLMDGNKYGYLIIAVAMHGTMAKYSLDVNNI